MKEELNEKQKLFCVEYLKDFNGTRAYKKVYWWTDESCRSAASRLLTNDNVQDYLASKVEKKVEKAEVWVDYVLDNLHQIVEIWMWRQDIELEKGKKKKVFDMKNVNSALEKLWKYHKMYTDRVEQDGNLNINIVSYKQWQN